MFELIHSFTKKQPIAADGSTTALLPPLGWIGSVSFFEPGFGDSYKYRNATYYKKAKTDITKKKLDVL